MMNAGNKKLILLLLVLSMLICGVMALGSTLASINYVDKTLKPHVTLSAEDKHYNVSLCYYDNGKYNTPLADVPVFTNDVPWCPGYTKIVYLKVTNNELFPVECTLNMDIGQSSLNSVMEYSLLGDVQPGSAGHPTSWRDIEDPTSEWTVKKLEQGSHEIFKEHTLQPGQTECHTIAVHMDENATNTHQSTAMSFNFQFSVNANFKPGADPKNTTAQ